MNVAIDIRSVSLRFFVVAALAVALMVPLVLVSCVAEDRRGHHHIATSAIAESWAGRQRIVGPMLLIPVAGGADADELAAQGPFAAAARSRIVVMPESLRIRVHSRHEMRRRGIYELPVLLAEVQAEATFAPLDVDRLTDRFGALRLDQAAIVVGVSDPRGIRAATLRRGDEAIDVEAMAGDGRTEPGLRGALADAALGGAFSLQLSLRGSGRLAVVPAGDSTAVTMTSTWPHPSFDGRFLPDEHEVRDDDGFSATWTVSGLARGFPRVMRQAAADAGFLADRDLGFSVFEPVHLYASVQRSVKYGALFVVLTLVSVLCLELLTGRYFHFVQYGVTGLAVVVFFLALLALAEHVGFALGYLCAALLLTAMIGWYAHGSTGDARLAALAAAVVAALYGVLYVLLRLESFALLVGAGVLLAALAMLMLATRRLRTEAQGEE